MRDLGPPLRLEVGEQLEPARVIGAVVRPAQRHHAVEVIAAAGPDPGSPVPMTTGFSSPSSAWELRGRAFAPAAGGLREPIGLAAPAFGVDA